MNGPWAGIRVLGSHAQTPALSCPHTSVQAAQVVSIHPSLEVCTSAFALRSRACGGDTGLDVETLV